METGKLFWANGAGLKIINLLKNNFWEKLHSCNDLPDIIKSLIENDINFHIVYEEEKVITVSI